MGISWLCLAALGGFVVGAGLQCTGFFCWLHAKMPWGKCKGGCK